MQDLTRGSISAHLLRLSLPLIAGNLLQQTYNAVDVLVIGRFAGEVQFSAVGVAGSVMSLYQFLIVGACAGVSVLLSEQFGARREEQFRRQHFTALSAGLAAALVLALLAQVTLPLLLDLTQTPQPLLAPVQLYLRVVCAGLPLTFLSSFFPALLQSTGDTRPTVLILLVSTLVNLVLDLVLVGGLGMGVGGAAAATVAAQGAGALAGCLTFRRLRPGLCFTRSEMTLDGALLRRTASAAAVSGVQNASLYVGRLLVQSAVNTTGTQMIAAFTAASRFEGYINAFGDSGCAAVSVVTAQNLGAGSLSRVRETLRRGLLLLGLIGGLCSAVLFLGAVPASALMLGAGSGGALQASAGYLRTVSLFYLLNYTGAALSGYLKGCGRLSISFAGTAAQVLLRAALVWTFLGRLPSLTLVALATGAGWLFLNLFWPLFLRRHPQPALA